MVESPNPTIASGRELDPGVKSSIVDVFLKHLKPVKQIYQNSREYGRDHSRV